MGGKLCRGVGVGRGGLGSGRMWRVKRGNGKERAFEREE